jgi:hypothetical protein
VGEWLIPAPVTAAADAEREDLTLQRRADTRGFALLLEPATQIQSVNEKFVDKYRFLHQYLIQ